MANSSAVIVPLWFIDAKKAGLSRDEILQKMQEEGKEIAKLRKGENAGKIPEGWAEGMYVLYSEYYKKQG